MTAVAVQLATTERGSEAPGSTSAQSVATASVPTGWMSLGDAAVRLQRPLRTLRYHVQKLPPSARRKIGGAYYVDARYLLDGELPTQTRLAEPFNPADWTPRSIRRDALVRRILADADDYAARRRREGLPLLVAADREFCALYGSGHYDMRFAPRTLQAWRRIQRRGGHFCERRGRKLGRRMQAIGASAEALFLNFYTRPGMSLRTAWSMVRAESDKHPHNPAWSWPSEATVARWRRKEHGDFYTDYYRRGADAWRAKHEPKLNRDPMAYAGGELFELDCSRSNFFAVHRGRKLRPVYALVVDVGTRMLVGHAVAVSESTELLIRALRRAVLRYGAPKTLRADQGKANRGTGISDYNRRKSGVDFHHLTGLAADMMCKFESCQGRSGWMKGSVESAVGTASMGFDTQFGKAYIGNNHRNRVRGVDAWADEHLDELTSLEEVDELLGKWIDARNKLPRQDMGGLSPAEKFAKTAIPFRKVPEAVLNVRLLRAMRVRVTNRGVPVRIGGEAIYFGANRPEVWERTGQELIARVNDDDLSRVLLCDLDGRPLFEVARDELKGVTSDTLREIGKRKAKARKLRREHFEHIDIGRTPTADAAIQLQAEYAEAKARDRAARAGGEVPESRGVVLLHSPFDAAVKDIQRQELRAAVGAEAISPPPGMSLADLMARARRDNEDTSFLGGPKLSDLFGVAASAEATADPFDLLSLSSGGDGDGDDR